LVWGLGLWLGGVPPRPHPLRHLPRPPPPPRPARGQPPSDAEPTPSPPSSRAPPPLTLPPRPTLSPTPGHVSPPSPPYPLSHRRAHTGYHWARPPSPTPPRPAPPVRSARSPTPPPPPHRPPIPPPTVAPAAPPLGPPGPLLPDRPRQTLASSSIAPRPSSNAESLICQMTDRAAASGPEDNISAVVTKKTLNRAVANSADPQPSGDVHPKNATHAIPIKHRRSLPDRGCARDRHAPHTIVLFPVRTAYPQMACSA